MMTVAAIFHEGTKKTFQSQVLKPQVFDTKIYFIGVFNVF